MQERELQMKQQSHEQELALKADQHEHQKQISQQQADQQGYEARAAALNAQRGQSQGEK